MADNARFTVKTEISPNADFSAADLVQTLTATITSDEHLFLVADAITGGGTFVTLDPPFDSADPTQAIIQNTDATNYVTVQFDTLGGATSNANMRVQPGQIVFLSDIDVGSSNGFTLTADTATVRCKILVLQD